MPEPNWIEKAKKHLRELDTHKRTREAAVIMAGLVKDLDALLDKLYLTTDGVRVVPNVDPIWIDPEEDGWLGEGPICRGFYENDEPIIADPIQITTWVAHKNPAGEFDHLWLVVPGQEEGDHWAGKVYSSQAACEARRYRLGGSDAR